MTVTRDAADEPGIERKLAFLGTAAAYPPPVREVRAVETHMSWVFLAGGFAYKLKKPVRLSHLDFSTVGARRRNCEEEVRLNRRLAPWVYVGIVPLTREADGGLAISGDGRVVDWLVKMHRLPEANMLDRRIAHGNVPLARVRSLVARLVAFYRSAPAVDWKPGDQGQRLAQELEDAAAELARPRYGLPAARLGTLVAAQRDFLAGAAQVFDRRVAEGRVVEGHGDLRPEHVCLDPGPVVIDCLEFDRELRLLDPVDELAFLALECERLGDRALGERLLGLYGELSGDHPAPQLADFYRSHRACVRAKLAVGHLREPALANPQKWLFRAQTYLQLAERYAPGLG